VLWLQVRSLAGRVLASVREMAGAAAPQPMPLEERRMALPGVGCWSPRCELDYLTLNFLILTLDCRKAFNPNVYVMSMQHEQSVQFDWTPYKWLRFNSYLSYTWFNN